jgi:hypothetical protein
MNKVRIRPRYAFRVPFKKEEVLTKLRDAIKNMPFGLEGKFVKPLVVLSINEENRHFWSPECSLDIERTEDGTEIRCTLGPRSALWTMFAAFYGFAVLLGIAGLVLGLCQWWLELNPYGFWLVPISVILLASAYGIALTGQKLAYEQMLELRNFIKSTLKKEHSTEQ